MNTQEEAAIALPTEDIVRWNARIGRYEFAKSQARAFFFEGWGDSGATTQSVGEWSNYTGIPPEQNPDYEEAVLYELEPELTLDYVKARAAVPQPSGTIERVSHAIKREGLKRLGVLNGSAELALGAVAALCLRRADIQQPVDRRLYDRNETIRRLTREVLTRAMPRGLRGHDGNMYSMYSWAGAFYKTVPSALTKLHGTTDARVFWWRELARDFQEIDQVLPEVVNAAPSGNS